MTEMKKLSTKLTSDRIATLGSRMMKFAPEYPQGNYVFVVKVYVAKSGEETAITYTSTDLTVGDIRDAGASLVSQSDGPEDMVALVSAMSPSERKSFIEAFNSVDVPKRKKVRR